MKMVDEDKNLGDAVEDRETEQGVMRPLDAEVAERVMGWHQSFIPPDDHYLGWFDAGSALQKNVECWEPSTEIADAMEVVEKIVSQLPDNSVMRNIGFARLRIYQYADGTWKVSFTKRGGSPSATADTLPEAICRAALHAMECLSISDRGTDGQVS